MFPHYENPRVTLRPNHQPPKGDILDFCTFVKPVFMIFTAFGKKYLLLAYGADIFAS
jgi:hypothetical protein